MVSESLKLQENILIQSIRRGMMTFLVRKNGSEGFKKLVEVMKLMKELRLIPFLLLMISCFILFIRFFLMSCSILRKVKRDLYWQSLVKHFSKSFNSDPILWILF